MYTLRYKQTHSLILVSFFEADVGVGVDVDVGAGVEVDVSAPVNDGVSAAASSSSLALHQPHSVCVDRWRERLWKCVNGQSFCLGCLDGDGGR